MRPCAAQAEQHSFPLPLSRLASSLILPIPPDEFLAAAISVAVVAAAAPSRDGEGTITKVMRNAES